VTFIRQKLPVPPPKSCYGLFSVITVYTYFIVGVQYTTAVVPVTWLQFWLALVHSDAPVYSTFMYFYHVSVVQCRARLK